MDTQLHMATLEQGLFWRLLGFHDTLEKKVKSSTVQSCSLGGQRTGGPER